MFLFLYLANFLIGIHDFSPNNQINFFFLKKNVKSNVVCVCGKFLRNFFFFF